LIGLQEDLPHTEKTRENTPTLRTFSMAKAKNKQDALDLHLHQQGIEPNTDEEIREFTEQMDIARQLYEARQAAGLTQQQLAELVGTKQQVISQLEDADYEGHSVSMLRRIAAALHNRVEIRLIPTS
jgi:ribosome-binding protein aMBF1 (putative translation factor)